MHASTLIVVNALATYGQSLFGIALALFSTRWLLLALGHEDYGIFGVVGSAILLMRILTAGLNVGITRFYAYSIGNGVNKNTDEARDDLMRWFNAALAIHVLLVLLISMIGLLLGEQLIENWLAIPEARIDASIWVFRFSIVTVLISFSSAPFVSMLTAYQRIYVVNIADVVRSIGVCVIAFAMLYTSGDRLIAYAFCMTCLGILVQGLLILSAIHSFPACRIRMPYLHDWQRISKLLSFTGWKLFGKGSLVLRQQGAQIVVNLHIGPLGNAAYTVANSLVSKADILSLALNRAFKPAVVSAEGAGNREKMLSMAMSVCKYSALMVVAFATPAIYEMENLLKLWLVDPPEYSAEICQWLLAMLIVDRITSGHSFAISALGKIAAFEMMQGLILISSLPLIVILFTRGYDLSWLGIIFFVTTTLYCIMRIIFASILVDFPFLLWFKKVALPVLLLLGLGSSVAGLSVYCFDESWMRILVTAFLAGLFVFTGAWGCMLDKEEKSWIKIKVKIYLAKALAR